MIYQQFVIIKSNGFVMEKIYENIYFVSKTKKLYTFCILPLKN